MHSTSTLPTAINVQTPIQPLLFAPDELRACGLRDAHTHPLVGQAHRGGRPVLAHDPGARLGTPACRVVPDGK